MLHNNKTLIVDAGNTALKIAVFNVDKIEDVFRAPKDDIEAIEKIASKYGPALETAICSVRDNQFNNALSERLNVRHFITHDSLLPLPLNYLTPQTLGIDRICNAVALLSVGRTEYRVSIDIGTCIKFDLIHSEVGYLGGSISAGIELRYRSLNDYTDNLPLLSNKSGTPIVGSDTKTSIQSGVINGIEAELNGMIEKYRLAYNDLTFFVTGGDSAYFDLQAKNDIFAHENLTLIGVFEIYKRNR